MSCSSRIAEMIEWMVIVIFGFLYKFIINIP